MKKVILIMTLSLLLASVPSSLNAQSNNCKPDAVIEMIENISDTPVSDALDIHDSATVSVGTLTEHYIALMNYRIIFEDGWDDVRPCQSAYIELYNAEMRVISATQDLISLSILLKSDIAEDDGSVDAAKQTLLQRIVDDFDLIQLVIDTNS